MLGSGVWIGHTRLGAHAAVLHQRIARPRLADCAQVAATCVSCDSVIHVSHRYGSYGHFAQAHSAEWMQDASQTTLLSHQEAWDAVMAAVGEIGELSYLTTIVCRVFEVRKDAASSGEDDCVHRT